MSDRLGLVSYCRTGVVSDRLGLAVVLSYCRIVVLSNSCTVVLKDNGAKVLSYCRTAVVSYHSTVVQTSFGCKTKARCKIRPRTKLVPGAGGQAPPGPPPSPKPCCSRACHFASSWLDYAFNLHKIVRRWLPRAPRWPTCSQRPMSHNFLCCGGVRAALYVDEYSVVKPFAELPQQ